MKKYYLLLLLGSLFLSSNFVFSETSEGSVITDPKLSRRCDHLLSEKNKRVEIKKKLQALIIRNKKLQKKCPKEKRNFRKRLTSNLNQLERELNLAKLKLQKQEEGLIRRGCPTKTL